MNEASYREAERALWADAGATPNERRVRLSRSDVEVRVQEVGEGPPTLFVHGGPNAGSTWAFLAARLPDLRCILVDRPGTGLSDDLEVDAATVAPFAETFVADVLDALGVERAHLVASSFGGYIALLSAARHPDRIDRTVQMGCPPFIQGFTAAPFMRLMMVPGFRQLLGALPPSERAARMTMRQIGHDPTRIPDRFFTWYVALQRHTPTFRNEMALIAGLGSFRGFDPSLAVSSELLGHVTSPTHVLWGENDVFGSVEVGRHLAGSLPDAEFEPLPGAGHLPWLDDADHAAKVVRTHVLG